VSADSFDLHELAGLFNVTEKAVRGWIAGGMPVFEHGNAGRGRKMTRISLSAAVRWYFSTNHERLELERARTNLAREQSIRLAYANAIDAGRLGDIRVLAREYVGAVAHAVTRLNTLPEAIAQEFDVATAPKVRAAVRRALNIALGDLRTHSEAIAREADVPVLPNKPDGEENDDA
jgi:hypothetical protein